MSLTPDECFLVVAEGNYQRVGVFRATDGTKVRQLTGPPGTLNHPMAIAVVPSTGQVLVADVHLYRVVQFRSFDDDTVVGFLGTGVQGNDPTQFGYPTGLAVLDGPHCPPVRLCCHGTAFHVPTS
jgi:hypothetical protein